MNPVDHPMGGGEGKAAEDIRVQERESRRKATELVRELKQVINSFWNVERNKLWQDH